jgi:predicted S18 family serine protease
MRRLLIASFTLVAIGCGDPPSKEMNQAQGAIDAAKAAGADTYAANELAAAVEALRKSEEAVTAGDYRTALSHALESRGQATAAAKAAVSARARARGDVERRLAEVSATAEEIRERLEEPPVARLPRRIVQAARRAIEAADKSLQEARTALGNDDYEAAMKALDNATDTNQKANTALDQALEKAAPRRRR